MSKKIVLQKEVAEKFSVHKRVKHAKANYGKFGTIDFSTLTLKKAQALFKRGFSNLIPKPAKKATTATTGR